MSNQPTFQALSAVGSIDGRYRMRTLPLMEHMSEFALMRNRVHVEIEYLIALSDARVCPRLTASEKKALREITKDFSMLHAEVVKSIETQGYKNIPATNHDVKAIEYFIKMQLEKTPLKRFSEWVHFALTSEDVNSIAYALGLRDALEQVMLPEIEKIEACLRGLAKEEARSAMLARTHGQSASPTTFGKEMAVFARRLDRQMDTLIRQHILVKFGGATGNWNAHTVAMPKINWRKLARQLVATLNTSERGTKHLILLELNETTTQIEPHDTFAETFDSLRRINTILLGLSQDMWRYISDGWVVQKPKEGEVGSSAMPHKVNPIDWENAEGNIGVANALFEFFSRKLPVSRLQRDLSDSTVVRVFGTALGHSLVSYDSIKKAFGKIVPARTVMLEILRDHPEVLAEAIQTVLRAEGVETPYELLKRLTRGKKISMEDLHVFITGLQLRPAVKKRLLALRPETYIGLAAELASE